MQRPLKIVLVDDNHDDNFFHSKVIERAGIPAEVRSFRHADQALDYLRSTDRDPVDIIFLDLIMPRMSGFDFVEAFDTLPRALRMGIVIYVLSVSPVRELRERAIGNDSVRGFIDKPLKTEIIADVVGEYFPAVIAARQMSGSGQSHAS